MGGLGNQLFIYAAARALAERTGAGLVLDIWSGFQRDAYQRRFSLQHFNIQFTEADACQSLHFPGGRAARKVLREFNNRIFPFNYVAEKDYEKFDPAVKNLTLRRTIWMEGFWQSPLYFDHAQNVIRREFSMKTPVSAESKRVAEKISKSNSVGLHARRLRNVLVGEENAKIKTLTLDYYHQAAERIARAMPDVHFFCFSDAPEWLAENLHLPYPTDFVTHNNGDERGHEDLWLMQQCRHFVISNSTFAWWAAWLGNAAEKMVMTPGLRYWDCKDILPGEWEIIEY